MKCLESSEALGTCAGKFHVRRKIAAGTKRQSLSVIFNRFQSLSIVLTKTAEIAAYSELLLKAFWSLAMSALPMRRNPSTSSECRQDSPEL